MFEQGPIRPPSEARSLLLRLTRNCPWNKCTFCPVYKGSKFSVRPVEDIRKDIDDVYRHVETLRGALGESGRISWREAQKLHVGLEAEELPAFEAAYQWLCIGGMKSVFLQDANSLVIKPAHLVEILTYLRSRFPDIDRITSYARAHTVARINETDLRDIREAGLNRLHIGLESGCDEVLQFVRKGATKEMHIEAGLKTRRAGMELSEYYIPGLGGREHLESHAVQSADALNKINPDFIRIRSLAIPERAPLYQDWSQGRFQNCSELEVVRELRMFLENLRGITSYLASDHVLNLFSEIEGRLPEDKDRMLLVLAEFLNMCREDQVLFQIGKRLGILRRLADMQDPARLAGAREACVQLGATPENVDAITSSIVWRLI